MTDRFDEEARRLVRRIVGPGAFAVGLREPDVESVAAALRNAFVAGANHGAETQRGLVQEAARLAPAQPATPATLPAQLRAEALRRGPLGESFIGAMPDMPEPAPVTYRAGTVPSRIDVGMVLQCPIGGTWRAVALGCDEVVFRLDHDTDEYGEGRLVLMGMASVSWWPLARDWTEPGGGEA
jgi:hypothetical protein